MDAGFALIVGALIALTGSALIPWLRESLHEKTSAKREREDRLRDSVTEVLAAGAAQYAAYTLDNDADLHSALEARARATARLLMDASAQDRSALANLINAASPGGNDGTLQVRALQLILTSWAAGELPASDAEEAYRAELKRLREIRRK